MLVTFIKASNRIANFNEELYDKVFYEINETKLTQEQKLYLKWMVSLTGKGIQNVLRSEDDQYRQYIDELEKTLSGVIHQSRDQFGKLTGEITLDEEHYFINWPSLLQLFIALGAQTLALRALKNRCTANYLRN